jgi:dipeptidyl aminopeptidase/acylaminoacyl peptidase
VFALLLSCTPVTAPPPATVSSATATVTQAPPTPTRRPTDLTIVAAGALSGDHALVLEQSQQSGGTATAMRFWDVPLDGGAPKQLLSYNQGERSLTEWDRFDFALRLSPDGRQLALADPVDTAGTGILVVDLVAGTTRLIRTDGGADQPAWSPDGTRIAYRGFVVTGPLTKESGIWVVDAAGGASRQVWASSRAAGGGATTINGWTENGATIAFSQDGVGVDGVDLVTGQVTPIVGAAHGVAWRAKRPSVVTVVDDPLAAPSPSGPRGAPSSIGQPGHVEVRETTFASSRVVYRHGDVGTLLWDPRWNPKTDEILFRWVCGAGARERDELVIVDAVRGSSRVLPTAGCVYAAAWSGDGTKILYAAALDALRVRNADGSGDRELFRPSLLPPGAFQHVVTGVIAFAPR